MILAYLVRLLVFDLRIAPISYVIGRVKARERHKYHCREASDYFHMWSSILWL